MLTDDRDGAQVTWFLDSFTRDDVVVIGPTESPEWDLEERGVATRRVMGMGGTQEALARFGAVDLLVNLRRDTGAAHLAAWRRLFWHVRKGGAYVVPREALEGPRARGLIDRLRGLAPLVGANADELGRIQDPLRREHAASISHLVLAADLVVIGKRTKHLLKLRDVQASEILSTRERGIAVETLVRHAPGALEPRGTATSYTSSVPLPGLETPIEHPAHFLRRYRGEIRVLRGAVVTTGHTVLPDTFRWHLQDQLQDPALVDVTDRFARLEAHRQPTRRLEGSYYYLDHSNPGHFGHLMTEGVAKFWGWDAAKRADPDLKVLLRTRPDALDRPEPRLETRLLEAYGVAPEDLVWVSEPVIVDSLVGATPMWHNKAPYYAHPAIADVWGRLREGIVSPDAPRHDRIFVTRRDENRLCRNAEDVERFFADRGFVVVRPETMSVGDQAGMFAQARVVAGFGGSGMFSLAYARNLESVIVLNHEAYDSRNEYLFAAVLGVDSHWFWSTPDLPHPDGGWSYDAFQSDWAFDFERNRADLEAVLEGLG